jgi:uncharacterized protein
VTTTTVIAVIAVAMAAGVVTTLFGFGFSLVAVPLLSVTLGPRDAVAVATILAFLATAAFLGRFRDHVQWTIARRQIAAAALGMPLGLLVLVYASVAFLQLAIAAAVVSAVFVLARGFTIHTEGPLSDLGAGFLSGVLNTSVGTNGPPLVAVNQSRGLEPHVFRSTLAAVFAFSSLIANPMMWAAGRYTSTVLTAAAVGIPSMFVGWYVGVRLHRHVDPQRFRALVLGLLLVTAATAAAGALFR